MAEAVFVFELRGEGRATGRRAGTGDRGRGVGPLVGLDVGGWLARIRGEGGGKRRHLGRGRGVRGGLRVISVVLGIGGGEVVCGVGGSAGGLGVRGRPVAGIGCRIGGDAGEGRATDVVAEGVLEGGEDGGELDLCGGVEGGVGELLVVKGPRVVVPGRGGGGRVLFVVEGEDAARVGVGHSSWGEVKVGGGGGAAVSSVHRWYEIRSLCKALKESN